MKEYAPGIQSSELSLVDIQTTSGEKAAAPDAALPPPAQPASSEASEDRFLARAREEHAKGYVDPSLWARAMSQAGHDKALATQIYLETRATALRVKKRQDKAARKARVVEALSQPDPGLELPAATPAAPATAARSRGRPNRRLALIATGVLACAVAITGVVVLWPASGPATGPNVAKAATRTFAGANSGVQTAPAAAKAGNATTAGDDVLGKVQALEKEGNWNLLVIYTTEWTRKQPFDPQAWRMLSVGYVKLHQYREALETAEKATELSPEDSRLWQNLGQVNLAIPRPAEALAAFQRAASLSDRDVVSLAQVGILNTQLGHHTEARLAFEQALAVSPADMTALCGAAVLAQKEGRAKDAEAMMLRVTALDARCPSAVEGETVRVSAASPAKKIGTPAESR